MTVLYAYDQKFSVAITFYGKRYGYLKKTRRDFRLRNLNGDSQEEQIEHARQITQQVVEELHHFTGMGIDKSVIKTGKTKVDEVIYSDLKLRIDADFEALLFRFHAPQSIKGSSRNKVSFRVPALVYFGWGDKDAYFFQRGYMLTRRRKRNPYGYMVSYDTKDEILTSFLARFNEEGNLTFSRKGYFKGEHTQIEITGRFWPKSKAKPPKIPRQTILASRPKDDTDYVYIIRMGRTNIYKIGKSNDPQGRLESLQTANPYKLKLIHVFEAENASAAEEELHRVFHPKRMEGEWFRLKPKEKDIILTIKTFKNHAFVVGEEEVKADDLFSIGE